MQPWSRDFSSVWCNLQSQNQGQHMLVMEPSPPWGSLVLCRGWTDMHLEKPADLYLSWWTNPAKPTFSAAAERITVGKITNLVDEQTHKENSHAVGCSWRCPMDAGKGVFSLLGLCRHGARCRGQWPGEIGTTPSKPHCPHLHQPPIPVSQGGGNSV